MLNFFKNRSINQTRNFYSKIMNGFNSKGIWGRASRFDPDTIIKKPSVLKHFVPKIKTYLSKNDYCLDLGCGPGGFLSLMAPICGKIVGADISPDFIHECKSVIKENALSNASAILLESDILPFQDQEFDRVIMVDTIHHLESHHKVIAEVFRVLKPGGLFLIFEPNKFNPLLTLLCILDPNEHGLLRLGTFSSYQKLLSKFFVPIQQEYNGMLVGPQGHLSLALADYVSLPGKKLLNWLSPKLFIVAQKKHI